MFQRKPTVKETVRTGQRDIARSVRDLDKEAQGLKREEARLRTNIKVELKKGNRAAATQMAKSLVRLQVQQTKLRASKDRISGVGTSLRVQQATSASAGAMAVAGSAVQAMNKSANPEQMLRNAQAFSRENARMDIAADMVGDALDDTFSDDEEEADYAINQVMDEIGIDLSAQLKSAPRSKAPPTAATAVAADDEDAEMRKLLASLK